MGMSSTTVAILVIVLAFAVLGVLFRSGRGLALVMEDSGQETNKEAMAKFTGSLMFALSGAASLWLLYLLADLVWALYLGTGLFVGLMVLSVFSKQGVVVHSCRENNVL